VEDFPRKKVAKQKGVPLARNLPQQHRKKSALKKGDYKNSTGNALQKLRWKLGRKLEYQGKER